MVARLGCAWVRRSIGLDGQRRGQSGTNGRKQHPRHSPPDDQDKTWDSFDRPYNGTPVTLACVFHLAQENGWARPAQSEQTEPASASAIPTRPERKVRIQSSAEFVGGYVPPDYIVDGLLQEGFLYSLTGATGAGKTAITLRLAVNVAEATAFAGRETKKAARALSGRRKSRRHSNALDRPFTTHALRY